VGGHPGWDAPSRTASWAGVVRLVAYRLRPVPWLALIGASAAWLTLVALLVPAQFGTDSAYRLLKSCSIILGLGGAFIVSTEIDPAEPVLRTASKPFWHTPAARMAVWLVLGTGLLAIMVAVLPVTALVAEPQMLMQALLPEFFLVTALSFLGATIAGSYVGGGLSVGFAAALFFASSQWRRVPFRLLDAPPARHASNKVLRHWYGGRLWTLALAIAFLTIPPLARRALLLLSRTEFRPA